MSLEPDLFGETMEERAIALIREWEPEALKFSPDGFHVSFSGGKDSIVVEDLVRRSGVKHKTIYNVTGIDPPELFRFIKNKYPWVERHHPKRSFYSIVETQGMPTMRYRWCCRALKESSGKNVVLITGVRSEESRKRAARAFSSYHEKRNVIFLNIIKDWKSEDVWGYIKSRGLEYPSLYDEGFSRLGCCVCPFDKDQKRSMRRWPHIWNAVRKSAYKRHTLRTDEHFRELFPKPEDYWNWWLSGMSAKPDENQCTLFEGGSE